MGVRPPETFFCRGLSLPSSEARALLTHGAFKNKLCEDHTSILLLGVKYRFRECTLVGDRRTVNATGIATKYPEVAKTYWLSIVPRNGEINFVWRGRHATPDGGVGATRSNGNKTPHYDRWGAGLQPAPVVQRGRNTYK